MIDPHWQLVDLDPRTWRNLGRFFDPGQYIRAAQPGEHGLFVLHEAGRVRQVFDTRAGRRDDLPLDDLQDPPALARRLHARGEWDRVHVIDQRHLAEVARAAQATPRRELSLDRYYALVGELLWGDPAGYACAPLRPATWNGWSYAAIRAWASRLPAAASLALGVLDGESLEIGLVLEWRDGAIRRVTTFEAFEPPLERLALTQDGLGQLWERLGQIAPPAAVLLCSPAAFEAWLTGADKLAALREAAERGQAYWRLAE